MSKNKSDMLHEKHDTKLHLGCGQRHLPGYLNIDFPPANHTVQAVSIADKHCDLLDLRYESSTLDEVRLHHVFEHFPRPIALALLFSWNRWLKSGGVIRIEVPDFFRTCLSVINPFKTVRTQCVGLRHIFGSNEASWATHYEGWTRRNFRYATAISGFELYDVRHNNHKGTYNIEFFARKSREAHGIEAENAVRKYLSRFTVDDSEGEVALLDIWSNQFKAQLHRGGYV